MTKLVIKQESTLHWLIEMVKTEGLDIVTAMQRWHVYYLTGE